jgi:hypothetical protein
MSVKIEILDYKYGAENLVDLTLATPMTWGWTATSATSADFDKTNTSGSTLFLPVLPQSLTLGASYNLYFKITNFSGGTGGIGFKAGGGVSTNAKLSGNGEYSETFVSTSTNININRLKLVGKSGCDFTIEDVSITATNAVDWDKSVVGELDVTNHDDFPLALTFQVSDIKNLSATTGDYSKTFKIPATKHNNQLFKNLYISNSTPDNDVTAKKKCRILVNNLYSLVGLLQVTGIGGYGEQASYYNCTFFGNNLSWANALDSKYMTDIVWGADGEGLIYNKENIMTTWQDEDCTSSSSYIVYPITSYGEYNPLGEARTIQLLDTALDAGGGAAAGYYGCDNSGTDYGTPPPSPDWRPAVFVKDTIDKIFGASDVGYTINSTFMNTDVFKKLVWILPNFKYNNPDERYSLYAAEYNFDTSVALVHGTQSRTFDDGHPTQEPYQWDTISVNTGTLGTAFDLSNSTSSTNITYLGGSDGFEIAEYGYYTIQASGLSVQLSNLLQDGAIPAQWGSNNARETELYIANGIFKLQVKTVGQTKWKGIAQTASIPVELKCVGSNAPNGYNTTDQILIDAVNFHTIVAEDDIDIALFLNKGDKIRLVYPSKFRPPGSSTGFIQSAGVWSFDVTPIIENLNIVFETGRVDYGQTYDLDKVMNPEDKQVDFIKGIIHAFNLKLTTDETTKTINIEPFDSFYKPFGDAVDWTYKLDRNKEITEKWITTDLKRNLVFKYKGDSSDKKVEHMGNTFFNGIHDMYPYKETLPISFEEGDSTFENPFFAGTFNAKDRDTISNSAFNDTAYSACLWTENVSSDDGGRPDKGFDFLPRLLYWNKYSPDPSNLNGKRAFSQTWDSYIGIISAGVTGSTTLLSTVYPQATSINQDSNTSPVLSYGNVWIRNYNDLNLTYDAAVSGKGLYETYYKNMIEMLKKNPRLRVMYIDLKINDIVDLDFRKLVYIDGVYWRINKILDYQPHNNQATKVELLEWFLFGTFTATAPYFGGGSFTIGAGSNMGNPIPNNDDGGNSGL